VRAGGHVAGQQPRLGTHLVEVLADRQRVPHRHVAVLEAGRQERRGELQQLRAGGGVAGRQLQDLDVEAGEPAQEPSAEGPRAVVAADDRQSRIGHGGGHLRMTRLVTREPGLGAWILQVPGKPSTNLFQGS
jgi:hypothetical protein